MLPAPCPKCEEEGKRGSLYTADTRLWECKDCGNVFKLTELGFVYKPLIKNIIKFK